MPSSWIKPNQGQSRSIKVNQGQSRSIKVNQGQSRSIKVNQGQSRSIKVNQGQSSVIKLRTVIQPLHPESTALERRHFASFCTLLPGLIGHVGTLFTFLNCLTFGYQQFSSRRVGTLSQFSAGAQPILKPAGCLSLPTRKHFEHKTRQNTVGR